jgi:hypothetical protein
MTKEYVTLALLPRKSNPKLIGLPENPSFRNFATDIEEVMEDMTA